VRLLLAALLLLIGSSTLALADDSWVSKRIMLKGAPKLAIVRNKGDDQTTETELKYPSYRVERDDDGWLLVRQDGVGYRFDKSEAVLLEDAANYFTERIRERPRDGQLYTRRAVAYSLTGKPELARKDFEEAVRLLPRSAPARHNLGLLELREKAYEKAIKAFDEAIRLDPKYADAFAARASARRKKGNLDGALQDCEQAIRLRPKDPSIFRDRAGVWMAKKEFDRAIQDYDEAIRLNPKDPTSHMAVAWFLATCPEAKYRDGKRAIEHARQACELSEWKRSICLDTLAAAYAEVGDFDEAMTWQKKALEDDQLEREARADYQKRLKSYEQKKPWRDEE
jgi:tetratricopeptide (TPR) repeat protein